MHNIFLTFLYIFPLTCNQKGCILIVNAYTFYFLSIIIMEVFMDSTHTFIQIHPKDNTAVALTSLKKDSVLNLDGRMYTLLEDIPQGHKFALEKISAGSAVIKYGSPIGYATEDIPAGS